MSLSQIRTLGVLDHALVFCSAFEEWAGLCQASKDGAISFFVALDNGVNWFFNKHTLPFNATVKLVWAILDLVTFDIRRWKLLDKSTLSLDATVTIVWAVPVFVALDVQRRITNLLGTHSARRNANTAT